MLFLIGDLRLAIFCRKLHRMSVIASWTTFRISGRVPRTRETAIDRGERPRATAAIELSSDRAGAVRHVGAAPGALAAASHHRAARGDTSTVVVIARRS